MSLLALNQSTQIFRPLQFLDIGQLDGNYGSYCKRDCSDRGTLGAGPKAAVRQEAP